MLRYFCLLIVVGVINGQVEDYNSPIGNELLKLQPENVREWEPDVLAKFISQMGNNSNLLGILNRLAEVPELRSSVLKILEQFRRMPQGMPRAIVPPQIEAEIFRRLNNPTERFFLLLAISKYGSIEESRQPWPQPAIVVNVAQWVIPILHDPHIFETFAHQVTQLLMETRLKDSWMQLITQLETIPEFRAALIAAFYRLLEKPSAKPLVIHAIILTLQRSELRPIFMKQFLEMLLSRTIPQPLALQILKILYTPMSDANLVNQIVHVLQYPRIRYRIATMVLNILFEPRLRKLVIGIILDTIRHPMFYPIVLHHTQIVLLQMIKFPQLFDFAFSLIRIPQARVLVNSFVLLFLRQPVQAAMIQGLMKQNPNANVFFQSVFLEPEVQPVAETIYQIKNMMSNPGLQNWLPAFVTKALKNPVVNIYVSSYVLNLFYQPHLKDFIGRLISPAIIQDMHKVLNMEISKKKIFVAKIKFECEKNVALLNPQPPIPVIPWIEQPVKPPQPSGVSVIGIMEHIRPPIPEWEPPRPPLVPLPGPCPPPTIIREPVFVPITIQNSQVTQMVTKMLYLAQQREYIRIQEIMRNLLLNPSTQHQSILQTLHQPILRPFMIGVIDGMMVDVKYLSFLSPTVLTAFRKIAQDTVIFRDIIADKPLFAKLQDIMRKIDPQPQLRGELFRFYVDLLHNSNLDGTAKKSFIEILRKHGPHSSTLERLSKIVREKVL